MPKKTSKPKVSNLSTAKRAPPPLRSTSGAGFEFEDLVSAWQLVKALSGEPAPGIERDVTSVQAQVAALGWYIDDLLLTAKTDGAKRCLAISVKGNMQVTASGLPADFVTQAWKQWHNREGPFNRAVDGLALVTIGTHKTFDPAWREVKGACDGRDTRLTINRIHSNKSQSRIFDSVKTLGEASDEETIELIRRLHVLPTDLQFPHSENKTQIIANCRRILTSGCIEEAQNLWKEIINFAKIARLSEGTITVPELLSHLRKRFNLHHHPDFESDWKTLANITADHKARIETKLPSGYQVQRTAEKSSLQKAIEDDQLTVVFGESGTGKSALVKCVLDNVYQSWNQVWFGPEDLTAALSAVRRSTLSLRHELSQVLNATVKPQNVLIIDAAERIEAEELVAVRQLLQVILPTDREQTQRDWCVVIVTQTQSWLDRDAILCGRKAHRVEVQALQNDAVKLALLESPTLGWLAAHDDTIGALTNLRTLAWVFKAGTELKTNAEALVSHTAIADCLWEYWTKNSPDLQALMMRLAKREASFERSFALTNLEMTETEVFTKRPKELPLRLNERTNCIEFEHDLAADWARFQVLKPFSTDTSHWAELASNPLWTNAIRMFGQFLLRQTVEAENAWDVTFRDAVAAKNELASDILLDALCLDPNAERFLTERIDLLLGNGEKYFTRLLFRFHHIATVPFFGELGLSAEAALQMEAQCRSIILGRWPPVLSFLIAHRERLEGLVSPALAKVIETWLTRTPQTLRDGTLMPFRKEVAQMALVMARTVQVEKGHGVMYLMTDKPLLYTAPLAGAADLPNEVGNWALELAGRREVDVDVKRRIFEVKQEKQKVHAERLKSDLQCKARHLERRQMLRSISSVRERPPPWPLGASREIDGDFRSACIKECGIQHLMRARPELAGEVLLALIIEDQPKWGYGSRWPEIDLGLEFPDDAHPTVFWKGQFFPFFQLAPETALTSLIKLVNFCTERWVSGTMEGRGNEPPSVQLKFTDGSKKTFPGWCQVYDWPQSNDTMHNANLYCALDALERWLTLRLDEGEDIANDIEKILIEGNSAAFVSVLVNVAKYRSSLLTGPLSPLLTSPYLFYWDSERVNRVKDNFDLLSWAQSGKAMFDFARDWILAPHRKRKFLDIVIELLFDDDNVARRLQAVLPTWVLPEDPKEALEFKLLTANLDKANYLNVTDPATGETCQSIVYPKELDDEVKTWQSDNTTIKWLLVLPYRCEERLRHGQSLSDVEAADLFDKLKLYNTGVEEGESDQKSTCRFAVVGTLVALGEDWLARNSEAKQEVFDVLGAGIEAIASSGDEFIVGRMGSSCDKLKFIAFAVMHLWLNERNKVEEWEVAVLCLLTSGDTRAVEVVVGVAYANREKLGPAWWRLLRAGLFWSGLIQFAPRSSDDDNTERIWKVWLERLRRFPLRGQNGTPGDLDFKRVAEGQERLKFLRQMRRYNHKDQTWRRKPERLRGGLLDGRLLQVLFNWLIEGEGTGDRRLDTSLALRIWNYDAACAKARKKKESGKYDQPSQNLGYDVLQKLAALTIAAPDSERRGVWEPILSHGPAAHYALEHFIRSLFHRLGKGDDPTAFERVWRETTEYGLVADWSQPGLSFYGERLICDLLGFGNADVLSRLEAGAALRMKNVYERWANKHLACDKECVIRFCYFLTTDFGAPLRLDGLRWLAKMLNERETLGGWYFEQTGEALVGLVTTVLDCSAQAVSRDVRARDALVEIAAVLAAKNISCALSLQERIKSLG